MSEWIAELAQRLVVKRKRDGRCVYDEQAKRELIQACREPGVSVSKLARQCGINSNQLSGWIRRHERAMGIGSPAGASGLVVEPASAFVPVRVAPTAAHSAQTEVVAIGMQAKLPNGIVLELQGCDLDKTIALIQTLGGLRCSASMKT